MSNALGLDKKDGPPGGSNRSFGVMFGFIFLIFVGFVRFRGHSTELQISGAILSAISFFVAFVKPDLLTKPNLYWMKFSLLLAKIVSPIVLSVLFFVLISPLAVALRLFGRDELSLKLSQKNSRWSMREVVGYPLESFKNQY